ncbi:acetyltransferase [Altererythrobacter sp. H2]|uniref:acetyltransferase n=1 Tax=Altererythrobacter sp. H2 TaxID=3108391 RepID=UPI002B4C1A07|nr:acetyltransferase [Altererythrobacter sp. H2]WRK94913.1 acetyltransferase [Altererythrobacter sp. H2]
MLAIYGAGGYALQMLDTVETLLANGRQACFVSDNGPDELCGVPVLRPAAVPEGASYCIAIAGSDTRKRIASGLPRFSTLVSPTAIISDHATIGEGSIIAHNTIIEAKARIGRHFHANIYSYVAHECTIGDFVTFAPRVNCNGNVTIGDGVYIGTGAMIKQGVTIGEGAVIGMGAVVTKDVPAGETWVGNPAKAR